MLLSGAAPIGDAAPRAAVVVDASALATGTGSPSHGPSLFEDGAPQVAEERDGVVSGETSRTDEIADSATDAVILTWARTDGGSIRIRGLFVGQPSQSVLIELYRADGPDGAGGVSEESRITGAVVTTDADGVALLDVTLPLWEPVAYVVATATPAGGETSETSAAVEVTFGSVFEPAKAFGRDSDERRRSLTVTDGDGTRVTFALRGPGVAELLGQDGSDTFGLMLTGTTRASSLRVRADNGGDGQVSLDSVSVVGSLGALTGKRMSVDGHVAVTGILLRLSADYFNGRSLDQHAIRVLGRDRGPDDALTMRFFEIYDATVESAIPIRSLRAAAWLDTPDAGVFDALTAPSLGVLDITGARRWNVDGDLEANVFLTDPDATVRRVRIRDVMRSAVFLTAGSIGSFTVGALHVGTVFAGVDPAVHPQDPPAIEQIGREGIGRFTVTRREGGFWRGNVAAHTIGAIRLRSLPSASFGTIGFTAVEVGSYRTPETRIGRRELRCSGEHDVVGRTGWSCSARRECRGSEPLRESAVVVRVGDRQKVSRQGEADACQARQRLTLERAAAVSTDDATGADAKRGGLPSGRTMREAASMICVAAGARHLAIGGKRRVCPGASGRHHGTR